MKLKTIKYTIPFVLTLLVGLWFGSFFERHTFSIHSMQNFSSSELHSLQGKTIKNVCYRRDVNSGKIGKIVGHTSDWGFKRIKIKYSPEKEWDVGYPKVWFNKCVEVIENDE